VLGKTRCNNCLEVIITKHDPSIALVGFVPFSFAKFALWCAFLEWLFPFAFKTSHVRLCLVLFASLFDGPWLEVGVE